MKKPSKSASKKPPTKKSPAPKARPAAASKRPAAASPKGAGKAPEGAKAAKPGKLGKGEQAASVEPLTAAVPEPAPTAPATPPPAAVVVSDEDTGSDEAEVPGEAIDGKRLALSIEYALKVTPKEGEIVFTRNAQGVPLVSGHNQRRCHTAFLPQKGAFLLESSVPQADAKRLAQALKGFVSSMVRVSRSGEVLIRHGLGQPPVRFRLGVRPITLAWEPPSQEGHEPAAGALRIQAAWQAAACRWSCAIVHTWQSSDGIEWCTLTHDATGELLARAVLAEDGKDLYPEDDRQAEIPGSRTAGGSRFVRAVERMGGADGVGMRGGGVAGADPAVATSNEGEAEPVVRIDGQPVTEAAESAAPPLVREWMEAAAWDALSADARAAFESVEGEASSGADATAPVAWERRGAFVTTRVSEGVAGVLWDLADEAGVDLYEGDAPPFRVWIAVAAWGDLPDGAEAELPEVAPGTRLALRGRDGWVTALAPSNTLAALERFAEAHDLTLHLGAEPPRTSAGASG